MSDAYEALLSEEKIKEVLHAVEYQSGYLYALDVSRAIERAAIEAFRAKHSAVAHVRNKYGDPEAFAERELVVDGAAIQKLPIGTKLYATTAPQAAEEKAE